MWSNSRRSILASVSRAILFMSVLATAWSLPILHGVAADLDPPKVFSGTLRNDEGNPVVAAEITAKNVGPLHCGMVQVRSSEVATDEHGHFSVQTGFYPVHLFVRSEMGTMGYPHNPYYTGQKIPLPLLKQSEHDLVLMRWAKVKGNVVDQKTGRPVSEFRVHFSAPCSHAPRSYKSKDGRFTEPQVTPGTQTISIMADGYAPSIFHAVSVPPGSVIDIGIVQMARGPTLTGHVFSANDKQPMVGAVIRFRDARTHAVVSYPPDELTATVDANGRFSVQNMPLLALEMFTSVEKPRHRTFTIGNVDMSLARRGTLEAIFFVDVKDEDLPHDH